MFGKRKNLNVFTMTRDGLVMFMDRISFDYMQKLEKELDDLKLKNQKLQNELDSIKPVIETGKLVPAVSKQCNDCKFVVKSRWNNQILGCRRASVCEDFRPEDQ